MYRATRLFQTPLIAPDADTRMGRNIGTPSLVRMPRWATGRLGRYHLYFSHHKGHYLRLAYADALAGPWRMYRPGALDLSSTGFPDTDGLIAAGMPPGPFRYGHIASPQVVVDDAARCFHLYFHGMTTLGVQATRYARSRDGVHFDAVRRDLGPEYVRATSTPTGLLAAAWGGVLLHSPRWGAAFDPVATLAPSGPVWRHTDIRWRDGGLDLLTTRIGDAPERIFAARAMPDETGWSVSPLKEILRPEHRWEGADLPLRASRVGMVHRRENALRDPVFFTDADGKDYMVYAGGGERGLGLARLRLSSPESEVRNTKE